MDGPAPITAPVMGVHQATQSLGVAGGKVVTQSGAINIPIGALTSDTKVSVAEVASSTIGASLPTVLRDVTPPTAFTPHGLTFSEPITISLFYKATSDTHLVVLRLDDEQDTTWEVVPAMFSQGVAYFSTTHFSIYSVDECDPANDPSGYCSSLLSGKGDPNVAPGQGGDDAGTKPTSHDAGTKPSDADASAPNSGRDAGDTSQSGDAGGTFDSPDGGARTLDAGTGQNPSGSDDAGAHTGTGGDLDAGVNNGGGGPVFDAGTPSGGGTGMDAGSSGGSNCGLRYVCDPSYQCVGDSGVSVGAADGGSSSGTGSGSASGPAGTVVDAGAAMDASSSGGPDAGAAQGCSPNGCYYVYACDGMDGGTSASPDAGSGFMDAGGSFGGTDGGTLPPNCYPVDKCSTVCDPTVDAGQTCVQVQQCTTTIVCSTVADGGTSAGDGGMKAGDGGTGAGGASGGDASACDPNQITTCQKMLGDPSVCPADPGCQKCSDYLASCGL